MSVTATDLGQSDEAAVGIDDPEYYDGLPTRPSDQEPSGGWDSTLLYTGLGGLVLMLIVGVALGRN